ncbi:MAG: hypothetical protein PHW50_01925 [Patescibacteria group bacterium]|nr:hypothetical protein [Patescibacteria group bacterium]
MEFSVGKIITSEKVGDHYFYTGSITPLEPDQAKKGTIFWLIEVTAPNPKIPKIIVNRLKKYYVQKEDGIWGFEQALKIINRGLAKQIQNKNTSWITHLNAIIGLAQDKTIHLAPTGDVAAYLFRENKISNILDVEESPPPHQTFVSVISGEIEKGDKMFLASSEFTSYMTIETLADHLRETTDKAISTIAQYFRNKNIRSINALALDFSKGSLSVDTIYLDQKPETTQDMIFKILKKIKDYTFRGIRALALIIGKSEYRILRNYLEKKNRQAVESKNKKSPLVKNAIHIESGNQISKLKNFISNEKRTGFLKKYQKQILIGLAVILLGAFVLTLILRQGSNGNKNLTENLAQAQTLYDEAITKLAANQNEEAYTILNQANTLADSAKDYPATSAESLALLQKIQNEINKITNATIISGATEDVGDFTQKGDVSLNRIFNLDNQIFTFNLKNNQFYSLDLNDKEISDFFNLPQPFGNIDDAVLFESDTNYFLIKNDQNQYYTYNFDDKKVSQALKSGNFNWPDSDKLYSYFNKAYFLENSELQRLAYTASGFTEPSSAAQTNNKIKATAIDGSIYFLTTDNQIEQYTSGTKNNFALNKPFFLKDSNDLDLIHTSPNSSYLFLYQKSANRILIFDKIGDYVKQLILPNNWGETQDLLDVNSNELFILASNKIYQISY